MSGIGHDPYSPDAPEGQAGAARWWHFPHGADVGLAARGASISEVFEEIAHAMTAVVTPAPIGQQMCVEIRCEASDNEMLLVDWLNELIYAMATKRLVFGRFEVAIENGRLLGLACGEPVDRVRHEPAVELKGATFTALAVGQTSDGQWEARCVVDV